MLAVDQTGSWRCLCTLLLFHHARFIVSWQSETDSLKTSAKFRKSMTKKAEDYHVVRTPSTALNPGSLLPDP